MSKSKIQIANSIVRNESVQINAVEFVMLLMLKKYYFLSGKSDRLELDHKKLMLQLGIGDNRTFKKILNALWQNGFIERIEQLPRGNPIEIKLNVGILECKNGFTQLPTRLLDKIDVIGCIGIRLLYFYESYINRKDRRVDYCCTSYDTIQKALKIGRDTIKETNDILVKYKLLKINKYELKHDFDFDDNENFMFSKWNNHYVVRTDKM